MEKRNTSVARRKSKVRVGMGSSDKDLLYPESSPKSRHEKAVGVSVAKS